MYYVTIAIDTLIELTMEPKTQPKNPKRIQIRYSVLPETKDKIQAMADSSHRDPANMLDFIVEMAWTNQLVKIEEPKNG